MFFTPANSHLLRRFQFPVLSNAIRAFLQTAGAFGGEHPRAVLEDGEIADERRLLLAVDDAYTALVAAQDGDAVPPQAIRRRRLGEWIRYEYGGGRTVVVLEIREEAFTVQLLVQTTEDCTESLQRRFDVLHAAFQATA